MNLDALTEVLSLLWDSRYHPGWQYRRSHGEGVAFEMQEDGLQAVYVFKDESAEGSKSTAGLHMSAPQLRGVLRWIRVSVDRELTEDEYRFFLRRCLDNSAPRWRKKWQGPWFWGGLAFFGAMALYAALGSVGQSRAEVWPPMLALLFGAMRLISCVLIVALAAYVPGSGRRKLKREVRSFWYGTEDDVYNGLMRVAPMAERGVSGGLNMGVAGLMLLCILGCVTPYLLPEEVFQTKIEIAAKNAGTWTDADQACRELRGCEPEEIVALLREEITDPGIPGMGRSRTSRALLFGKTACWLAETGDIPAEDAQQLAKLALEGIDPHKITTEEQSGTIGVLLRWCPAEDRARFLAKIEGERELSPEMQRQLDQLRKQP